MTCKTCEALNQPGALCAECAAALIATSSEKNCGCGHPKETHSIKHPAGDAICSCGCVGFERAGAAGNALDDINAACGYAEWDYPGQVVRAVRELNVRLEKAEAALLRATSDETVERVLTALGFERTPRGELLPQWPIAEARTRVAKAIKGEE